MFYFDADEFHGWYPKMSKKLLIKLDFLRDFLGAAVALSNIPGGIGRNAKGSYSQHNVDRWGEVRAVDGYIPEHISYAQFYEVAKRAGFTGIGLYTGWPSGRRGFHVDVRDDRNTDYPATWAGFYDLPTQKTTYKAIEELINA